MELITTYPAAVNSKATVTMGVLDQATTIVEVLDATVLPEAPNLLVLGTDQTAETVLMTARENNTLTIQRAVQGIAKSWPAGTQIARNFTGKDWDDMRSNVEAIVTKILGLTASDVGARPDTWTPTASDVGALPVRVVTSGSFNDIKETGAYYISNNVTDKPANTGGLFIVYFYNSEIAHGYYSPNNRNGECPYMCLYNGSWVFRGLLPLDGSVPMSGNTLGFNSFQQSVYGSYNTVSLRNWKSTNDINKNGYDLSLYRNLGANNALYLQEYVDGKATSYRIFGEHNKPSGSYTGNGSATERSIATGGIGNVAVITSDEGTAIITRRGSFIGKLNSFSYIKNSALISEGKMWLNTTDETLNKNGVIYSYQVL